MGKAYLDVSFRAMKEAATLTCSQKASYGVADVQLSGENDMKSAHLQDERFPSTYGELCHT